MGVLNVDADGHTVDSLRRRTYTIEKGRARVALLLVILREKIIRHLRVAENIGTFYFRYLFTSKHGVKQTLIMT